MASGVEAPSFSLRADRVGEIALPESCPFALTQGVGVGRVDRRGGSDLRDRQRRRVGASRRGRARLLGDRDRRRGSYATVVDDTEGDVFGHGTACAGIIRSLAPGCEIDSVRVLGPANRGSGSLLLAGLEWAVARGDEVINMSLSTASGSCSTRCAG